MTSPRFTAAEATSVAFWRELCPALTIEGGGEIPPARLPALATLREAIRLEGYINAPDVLPLPAIARLRGAIETLHGRGIPPAFAFVYDEFWQIFRSLAPYLAEVLGTDYRALPAFWAWYVEPTDAASGWVPHRDRPTARIGPDNIPESLSVWLPLTEATPLNGCMYVVPAPWDDHFKHREAPTQRLTTLEGAQLQNIRALPAAPGALLSWNQALFHWGGRASKLGTGPRCSISVEFQRGDIAPLASPLIHPEALLPFRARLGLVGHLFRAYTPFHRVTTPEIVALAAALEWKFRP
ncbi:MAG: hypothetical protein RLZZ15_2183 [Verrucomicrobiota bacterium]|jgi:hypothetical protein